jgi:L-fucose mutarotase
MLINIDPILSPELLSIIRSMGHGDKLVLCDANYPAISTSNKIIRMDGVNIPKAAKAILSVFPLDSFIPEPVRRMEIDSRPDDINDVHKDLIEVVKKVSGLNWHVGSIERQKFYKESLDAFATVVTGESRPYGCFIFTRGVIKPDGSVWILGED